MDENIKVPEVKENVSEFKQKYDGLIIHILGTDYTIRVVSANDERMNYQEASGTCEAYSKELYVKDFTAENDPKQYKCIDKYCKKVLRHEIVHAVFFEAGLGKYFEDEELTETLAHLAPKMSKIMEAIDLI